VTVSISFLWNWTTTSRWIKFSVAWGCSIYRCLLLT